jgi:hypothetical protein
MSSKGRFAKPRMKLVTMDTLESTKSGEYSLNLPCDVYVGTRVEY